MNITLVYDGLKQKTIAAITNIERTHYVQMVVDPYFDLSAKELLEAFTKCHQAVLKSIDTGNPVKVEGLIGQ